MKKNLTFRRAIVAPAMLFLCGIFLQSCTEEMPILTPLSLSGTASAKSNVVINVNNSPYTLKNVAPGYAMFASISAGASGSMQYDVSASNGSQTQPLDFVLAYATNSKNQFSVTTSQIDFNSKTYTTLNLNGTAKLTVDKMDVLANTASGSFGYYLYDSVFSPTDSIYVSGTFNVTK